MYKILKRETILQWEEGSSLKSEIKSKHSHIVFIGQLV